MSLLLSLLTSATVSPHPLLFLPHCFLSPPPPLTSAALLDFSSREFRRLVSPSAHSNPNLLKHNRRSRYGDALSIYDSDDDHDGDDEAGQAANLAIEEVNSSRDDVNNDDDDELPWFNDDDFCQQDDEFAEPANLYRGQQRSKLVEATKTRPGTRRKANVVGGKAGSKGKFDVSKGANKKYAQLSEEFRLDNRWIPLLDYLSTFGMKESHFIQMHRRHMNAFNVNVFSVRERLGYLMDVGVKHKNIKKMLSRQPQILEYTVDRTMKPRVSFLLDLGVRDSKIPQVITASPSIFSCSVENSLKPTVRYLIEEVGIKTNDLGKVVTLSPQILRLRVDVSWNDRFDFLSEELAAPRENIVKMVTKHPQLLHYSIEDGILPRINFLRSIGLQNSDILKVLTSITQVLSLSLEKNLKPKYIYLVNELQNEVQSLTKYPMYLSLSLGQRIRPRHRFLVFLNKAPEGPFPLSSLLPSDESFCQQWAGTSVDQYIEFRQNMMLKEFAKKYEKH